MREVGRSNRLAPTIFTVESDRQVKGSPGSYAPLILIPAYNAAASLPGLIQRIRAHVLTDVLVVDDGSSDQTFQVANAAGCACLRLDRNQGKGAALMAGFRFARHGKYTHVITIDADGQHPPETLDNFLRADLDVAIVTGCRKFGPPMPSARRASNTLTSIVLSILTGSLIPDSQCGYRRYRLDAIRPWRCSEQRFGLETEVLLLAGSADNTGATAATGSRIATLPVATIYGEEKTSISGLRDTITFLRVCWRFLWR